MKGFKRIEIANFNSTFGEKNEPMMEHFFDIIYPSLKSGIRRKVRDDEYLFGDVDLIKSNDGDFILTGLIIRKTKLEVKSLHEENSGIIPTDILHDSAPYSAFALFLKNHRMIYIKNQKGSPGIKTFESTAKEIIKRYTVTQNKELDQDNKLPMIVLNVTNVPSVMSIDEQLKEVKKIKKLTFRLYPLNGDLEFNNMFSNFRDELSNLGSRSGNMNINTPKNKPEVSEMIKDAGDKADVILETILNDGSPKQIRNENYKAIIHINLPEENDINENIKIAIDEVIPRKEFQKVSRENTDIYDKVYFKLTDLYNKLKKEKS